MDMTRYLIRRTSMLSGAVTFAEATEQNLLLVAALNGQSAEKVIGWLSDFQTVGSETAEFRLVRRP